MRRQLSINLKYCYSARRATENMSSSRSLPTTGFTIALETYQYSNNTIILFATQHMDDNTAFHRSSTVSGGLALLRAFFQWNIEHQVSAVWKARFWGTWLCARETQAVCMKVVARKEWKRKSSTYLIFNLPLTTKVWANVWCYQLDCSQIEIACWSSVC